MIAIVCALVALLLTTSCAAGAGSPVIGTTEARRVGAPSAATTTLSPPAAATSSLRIRARVSRVVDGDTIHVLIAGRDFTVRYIGIDTPETVDPREPVQCFGREASAYNKALVDGKEVELEKDVSETDRYDRLLRYVYVGGKMVNEDLVRNGYAHATSYPPDVKYQDRFGALEAEARAKGIGLWAPGACTTPSPSPIGTAFPATTTPPPSNAQATHAVQLTVTSPVRRGATATAAAKTSPRATCAVTVTYKSGPSSASGLGPKTADSSGAVSWSWTVGTNTTPGAWPVDVACTSATGARATARANITVQ